MKPISFIVQKDPTTKAKAIFISASRMGRANGCPQNTWNPSVPKLMNFVHLSPTIKSFYSSPEAATSIGFRRRSLRDIGEFSDQLTAHSIQLWLLKELTAIGDKSCKLSAESCMQKKIKLYATI